MRGFSYFRAWYFQIGAPIQLLLKISSALPLIAAPALTVAGEHSSPAIYRCSVDGVATFSDRPCGAENKVYEPRDSVTNTYTAPAAAPSPSRPARQAKVRKSSTAEERARAEQVATCERIALSLKEIRSRMRSGYSAAEGERLKERQAKLETQRRGAKCR